MEAENRKIDLGYHGQIILCAFASTGFVSSAFIRVHLRLILALGF